MIDWEAVPVALMKPFRSIIFDWDGTAVVDRRADASMLREALEPLLQEGVLCAIITGTHFENISEQLLAAGSESWNSDIYVCTNRGSEVYRWKGARDPELLYRRVATADENVKLDQSAAELRAFVEKRGVGTELVSNRLNRRKLDLIPIDPWKDPKKAQFAELFAAVSERLRNAGIEGGLKQVVDAGEDFAVRNGLPGARITSDIKHVEIGLTDKSDSLRWLKQNLLEPRGISPADVLLAGDELGSIGGVPGSDSLMRIEGLETATVLSVGVEPEGVPPGVLHLPGGPATFIDILRMQSVLAGSESKDWVIELEGFDPTREREMETLFSLGNGYLGVRGSVNLLIPTSQPNMLLAGVYDRKVPQIPYSEQHFLSGQRAESPYSEIVPFPFPFPLSVSVGGVPLNLDECEILGYQRMLNLREGILYETFRLLDRERRETELKTLRCASLEDPHLLFHEISAHPVNHTAPIRIATRSENGEFALRNPHLEHLGSNDHRCYITRASKFRVCIESKEKTESSNGDVRVRRMIAVATSRDDENPESLARDRLAKLGWGDFEKKLFAHKKKWREFWDRADVRYVGNPSLTQAQRFNLFQLRIGVCDDPKSSLTARSLTGTAYEGHVFWDTEIFAFPVFLYTFPEIAKSFLEYRYSTLQGAKRTAKAHGCEGACFAWESTVTGDDETPRWLVLEGKNKTVPVLTGEQQIHVTADVALAIWRYWQATRDEEFMKRQGCEILVETARFWAGRVKEEGGKYHILKVIGPDEYHPTVDDNAYTNWMARFNLERSAAFADWLCAKDPKTWQELSARIGLSADEPASWRRIAAAIYFPGPNRDGVIEQFRGFFDLQDEGLGREKNYKGPFNRLLNWEQTIRSKVLKQADVLMIPYLFPDAFPREIIEANYNYYEPLTEHASSLSPPVHAAIAARIGRKEEAFRYWEVSLQLDLLNLMNNSGLGFHSGCSGGAWQTLVFHFLEIHPGEEGLRFGTVPNPFPIPCDGVELGLRFRGRAHSFHIDTVRRAAA